MPSSQPSKFQRAKAIEATGLLTPTQGPRPQGPDAVSPVRTHRPVTRLGCEGSLRETPTCSARCSCEGGCWDGEGEGDVGGVG